MRYILILLSLIYSNMFCLEKSSSRRQLTVQYCQEPKLSAEEKNSRQIQLADLGTALIQALKVFAKPKQIQEHLTTWDNLKTLEINIETDQIEEIIMTARTMQVLASNDAQSLQNVGLRTSTRSSYNPCNSSESSRAVDNYVTAQCNYNKICNHLGIKK